MMALTKILHVLAAVVLLGNLIMAPFWRKRLAGDNDPHRRAVANRSVRMADWLFTLPGWVVILVTGVVLSIGRGWQGSWLHFGLLLFVVWLAIWHIGTLRARKGMIAKADEVVAGGQVPEDLARHERQWVQWSYISALLAVLILTLMVSKPF